MEPEAEAAEEAAVPEPVEAQLAAAGAGKDADIFAVVMVGLLALALLLPSDKYLVVNLVPIFDKLTPIYAALAVFRARNRFALL